MRILFLGTGASPSSPLPFAAVNFAGHPGWLVGRTSGSVLPYLSMMIY